MSKSLVAFIGALIVLLAVQTWRVHALNQRLSAIAPAAPALKPQLERSGSELGRTDSTEDDAPSNPTSIDGTAKTLGSAIPFSVSGKTKTREPQTVESEQQEASVPSKKKSQKTVTVR